MVTLTTTVYEKDFRLVLNKNSWYYNIDNPLITKKIIIINNINSTEEFLKLKNEFEDVFEFYYSNEYVDKINETFNLNINLTEKSYYYSVHHYTNLIVNKINKFLFQVSSDCSIISDDLSDFFENSMLLLDLDESVITTTLPWTVPEISDSVGKEEQKTTGKLKSHDNFYFSDVFSDQVYFCDITKLKKCDLSITKQLHPFPSYGINSFEYRLTNHLKTNDNYRAIYKTKTYYIHKSF
jgi:hypothetical protein